MFLLLLLVAPLGAQNRPSGFTIGLRASGLVGTSLIRDDIGQSFFPDTLLQGRLSRDTIKVGMPIAPDLTLVVGLPLNEDTDVQLAAGYTLGRLEVSQGDASRDAGDVALGHAIVSIRKPVRGVLGRLGIGVMWFHGGDITVFREMRTLNPVIELAAMRRWVMGAYEVEAGLVAQAAQLSSAALEVRQGPPGMYYRIGLELGGVWRIGR